MKYTNERDKWIKQDSTKELLSSWHYQLKCIPSSSNSCAAIKSPWHNFSHTQTLKFEAVPWTCVPNQSNLSELYKEQDGPRQNKNTKLEMNLMSYSLRKKQYRSDIGHVTRIPATSPKTMSHLLHFSRIN